MRGGVMLLTMLGARRMRRRRCALQMARIPKRTTLRSRALKGVQITVRLQPK